ncbi:hypothetical protein ACQ4LH_21015, partial [Pseudomonas peli]
VLPHKHPHELLDSVVKERVVDSFVSTEARILQQPHLPSSDFEVISEEVLSTQPLALHNSSAVVFDRSKTSCLY